MLHIIVGAVDIVVGFLIFLAFREPSAFASSFIGITSSYSFFVAPTAVAWFTLGTLAFIVAPFIWKGNGWAWLFGLVLATDALVLSGFGILMGSLAVTLPLAVYGLILIFLGLTQVRAYCGRTYVPGPFIFPPVALTRGTERVILPAYPPSQSVPMAQQPYARPLAQVQQATWMMEVCPSCGASTVDEDSFCFRCGTRLK